MEAERALVGATVAGKYRVVRIIGSGAMGIVCEARHLELGKRVAIKLIESSLGESDEVVRRFRREARAVGSIESEHIVQVFDVGLDPALGHYMVLEYLAGEDLEKLLAREERLDVAVAARVAYQVARALAKAHAAGVVHRDLKPANVFLVDKDDAPVHVKVLDFGISKLTQPEGTGAFKLTAVGMTVGSPMYSSPEQVQGLIDVDHRTDVWSLGVVLYEMIAGRPAYGDAPTYEEFVQRILHEEPEPLVEVAPWVPPALASVVHAAIRHDRAQRIPDASTFARLLVQAAPELSAESGERRVAPPRPRVSADDTVQAAPPMFDDLVLDEPDRPKSTTTTDPTEVMAPVDLDSQADVPTQVRVRARPSGKDSGGILVVPPRRAQMPTIPSIVRTEERRARTRTLVLSIVAVLVAALAVAAWAFVLR